MVFCHCAKKPVTTMLTYPWKCTVLHCNHLGNTWKPQALMTRHFDYCPSTSEGDNQSVGSSAPVVSRCFPGGYNVKLYISRGRLAWWLLAFLCCVWFYIETLSGSTKCKHAASFLADRLAFRLVCKVSWVYISSNSVILSRHIHNLEIQTQQSQHTRHQGKC